MKFAVLFLGLGGVAIFLLGLHSPLRTQEIPSKVKGPQSAITGLWSEIWYENQGTVYSSLPEKNRHPNALGPNCATIWEISKEGIEWGAEIRTYPRRRYTYKLDPDGRAGTLDLFRVDGAGKPAKLGLKATYNLNGDILTICVNVKEAGKRPEKFTSTGEPNTTWLWVLRRGKLKWGPDGPMRPL